MIERLIEWSIRNRYLVMFLAGALALWAVYAVLNTPVDAIPDLSENQVIVFTDWMGRSPREIEDQVTYPLSLKLQGLAGVKVVRQCTRPWADTYERRQDPRGRDYFWNSSIFKLGPTDQDTDVAALRDRYITVTPLQFDLTDPGMLREWQERKWPS